MRKVFLLFFIFLGIEVSAQEIPLYNGSFEDFPRAGGSINALRGIKGWKNCGISRDKAETPPDSHAGGAKTAFFDVTVQPHDGRTFLGMVARENDTWEAVSQRLIQPLESDKCYAWRVYLCKAPTYNSALNTTTQVRSFTRPIVLRIWGGNDNCDRRELLAESTPVSDTAWVEYAFTFEPTERHNFILLEAFYKTPTLFPYNGNILFDGGSSIVEMACDDDPAQILAEHYNEDEKIIVDNSEPEPVQPPAKAPEKIEQPIKTEPKASPPPKEVVAATPEIKEEKNNVVATPKENKKIITQLTDKTSLKKNQVIRMEQLLFPADSAMFEPNSTQVLDEVYSFLNENPRVRIEVRGHTNNQPLHKFCDKLSTARAKSVRDYLVQKGISADRISYKGYGKRKPIASNATPAGRARNQRVEIKIISLNG